MDYRLFRIFLDYCCQFSNRFELVKILVDTTKGSIRSQKMMMVSGISVVGGGVRCEIRNKITEKTMHTKRAFLEFFPDQ